jgi:hypothetical protein
VGTGTTGGASPEVSVDIYSESDFQILNRFVSRSVLDVGNLEISLEEVSYWDKITPLYIYERIVAD